MYNSQDGITNRDPTATAVYNDEAEEGVEDDSDCPFMVSSLTQEIISLEDDPTVLKLAMLRALKTGQPVLSVGRGEKPLTMFRNPQVLPSSFPWLFPYGLRGYRNTNGVTRTKKVGFDA
jgi:hypothetical protein